MLSLTKKLFVAAAAAAVDCCYCFCICICVSLSFRYRILCRSLSEKFIAAAAAKGQKQMARHIRFYSRFIIIINNVDSKRSANVCMFCLFSGVSNG